MSALHPDTTVLSALAGRLASDPDGPYLDFEGDAYTVRRMDAAANRCARALAGLGVVAGDRVATLLENVPEQVVSFFGSVKLGAIQVPVNTAYKGEFLRHQLADSGARVFVVQGDFAGRLADLDLTTLPELESVIVVGTPDRPVTGVPVHDWSTICAAQSDTAVDDPGVTPADLACFIYTAGTTGPSKGCMLPHHYVASLGEQIARAWEIRPDDCVFTPLPLFHFNAISVCVVGGLVNGHSAAIVRRFSVSNFWPEVVRTNSTIASLLGSLAILVGDAEEHPAQAEHRLRLCVAAPMPPATDEAWRTRFGVATFSAGFGLTEASLLSALPAREANRPGAAGRLNQEDFEVTLVDDHDQPVPVGEIGEIVARPRHPNSMFAGYWRRPDDTVAAFRNLWFHTGDLGRLDDDGFLSFVDRKKDYLRRRGENISSFEMEKVFHGHEAINDVAVHSVPSAMGEDDLKVTAVLVTGATITEEELCAWVVERVPYFAVPRYIEFRDDLPRNPVGRVLKYQLRDEGVTGATWDREASGFTFERR
ncbi:MAG: AMP-binding protein [Actinomycetes bacterium]